MKILIATMLVIAASAPLLAQQGAAREPEPLVLGERGCMGPVGSGKRCENPIDRPPLFFKAEWRQPTGKSHPATPQDTINPNLITRFYGPDAKNIVVAGTDIVTDAGNVSWLDPSRIWTGLANSPVGVTFADKTRYIDLTRRARIGWTVRTSGFHVVRPIVKLANGNWLIGDHAFAATVHDYVHEDFVTKDIRWRRLDVERMVTVGEWPVNVDLTQVDEIGFADLMPGSGHNEGGFITVTDMEVYAQPGKPR